MATEKSKLRIKAEKLGAISDVTSMLTDLEAAYNSIYAFEFLVDSLVHARERRIKQGEERFQRARRYWKELPIRKDYPPDPFFYEFLYEGYAFDHGKDNLPSLLELQRFIEVDKIVIPEDRLVISKVNIQSPGFWEVLGSMNPLKQIREFLKDRHERQKDKDYRNRQDEEKGNLEIEEQRNKVINGRVETLRNLGYSDQEIRQLISAWVDEPLNRLGRHQDNGQIEGPDGDEPNDGAPR